MVYRLNPYGSAFYRAGYRLPGPNKPATLANSISLLSDPAATRTEPGHSNTISDDFVNPTLVLTADTHVIVRASYLFGLTQVQPSRFDKLERGVQFGYTSRPLSARLSWLNGIDQNGDGAVSLPGNRFHDYVLQSDYLLG